MHPAIAGGSSSPMLSVLGTGLPGWLTRRAIHRFLHFLRMPPRSPDAACPCGRGRTFKRCCRPLHQGRPAADIESLMRSRFSAYAVGAVDYIVATTDPEGPQHQTDREAWAEEIREFSARTRFEKLEIRDVALLDPDHGEVLFFAKLTRSGQDVSFCERSSFVRRADRWLYVSGVVPPDDTDHE
jgi:SEC-C motif domain protein